MSEYMNDDDRVLVLRRWWEGNGTSLIVTSGAGHRRRHRLALVQRLHSDARRSGVGHLSALSGSAAARCETGRSRNAFWRRSTTTSARTGYRAFSLFYRAHDAAEAQDFAKATEYLETVVKDTKDDRLRDVARLRVARLQVQAGNTDAALETLRKITGQGFRSYVAELKGDILLGQHKIDEAREAYQAAAAAADKGEPQPVLQMKITDLAKPERGASGGTENRCACTVTSAGSLGSRY